MDFIYAFNLYVMFLVLCACFWSHVMLQLLFPGSNWTSPKTSPRVETNEYWEVLKQCSFVSECKVKSLQIIQKPSYQELECTIIINLFNTPHSKKYLCPDYYMPIFLFVTKAPCAIWIFTFQFTPNTFSFKIKKKNTLIWYISVQNNHFMFMKAQNNFL